MWLQEKYYFIVSSRLRAIKKVFFYFLIFSLSAWSFSGINILYHIRGLVSNNFVTIWLLIVLLFCCCMVSLSVFSILVYLLPFFRNIYRALFSIFLVLIPSSLFLTMYFLYVQVLTCLVQFYHYDLIVDWFDHWLDFSTICCQVLDITSKVINLFVSFLTFLYKIDPLVPL